MITATLSPAQIEVEILSASNGRVEVRTLDGSRPFVQATNALGARFYTSYKTVAREQLTDIKRDGVSVLTPTLDTPETVRFDGEASYSGAQAEEK